MNGALTVLPHLFLNSSSLRSTRLSWIQSSTPCYSLNGPHRRFLRSALGYECMTRKILSNLISTAQGAYQKSFMTHGFNFLRCTNTKIGRAHV